ncbi:MAG TPA: hypothetical protein VFG87_05350 [Amycolatopsis sp.]|nr:hypothetical protein [Amycolatopsis sp.]
MKTATVLTASTVLVLSLVNTALAPGAAAAPAARPAVPNVVPLADNDNGRTVTASVGDQVSVRLGGTTGVGEKWVWDVPKASSADVLSRVVGGTTPSGDGQAVFVAAGIGASAITAHEQCVVTSPGMQCPHGVKVWQVTVSVQ